MNDEPLNKDPKWAYKCFCILTGKPVIYCYKCGKPFKKGDNITMYVCDVYTEDKVKTLAIQLIHARCSE